MLEYIRGKLEQSTLVKAVVDVGGLGYLVHIPLSVYAKLPQIGAEVTFFISTVIREDSHKLYGFLTQNDRDFFEKLNEVSGIGPKTSLALLGALDSSDLQNALSGGNIALLHKVPGIGKKTAERLIVEMRDKVKHFEKETPISLSTGDKSSDAIQALIHLGYQPLNAQKAVKKVLGDNETELSLPELITSALRCI